MHSFKADSSFLALKAVFNISTARADYTHRARVDYTITIYVGCTCRKCKRCNSTLQNMFAHMSIRSVHAISLLGGQITHAEYLLQIYVGYHAQHTHADNTLRNTLACTHKTLTE